MEIMRVDWLSEDEQGVSRFREERVPLSETQYAPPAPSLGASLLLPASSHGYLRIPAGWEGDWHPSPARQLVIVLRGVFLIEAGSGEKRSFGAGSVILHEDTRGRGHRSRVAGGEAVEMVVVRLP
jgi:hypothetical protein